MPRFSPRALVFCCLSACALTGAAAAEPALIVYAGTQGNGPLSLSGGGANSYGYGAQGQREGAVIDLRRPTNVVAQPSAVAETAPQQGLAPQAPAEPWLERERVGPPYQANGRWYAPTPEPGYAQTGTASWYGPSFHGQATASGEIFDQEALTAAHPTLPIGSLVQVTNLENGREIIVRVNDRGPFVHERLIDLSRQGAAVLGFERAGQARVHVRYLGPAPRRVNADATPIAAMLAQPANLDGGPVSLLPPALAPQHVEGGYFVQVGAYADLGNAHRVREAVGSAGPVLVDARQSAAGELFRVRVGPWASREAAEAARAQLAALGYGESVVTSR